MESNLKSQISNAEMSVQEHLCPYELERDYVTHKLFLLECKKDLKIHNISTLENTIDTIEENSKELMTCLDDKLFEIKHQLMFVLDAITKYRKVLAEIDQEVSINYKCPCLYPVKDNEPKCTPKKKILS